MTLYDDFRDTLYEIDIAFFLMVIAKTNVQVNVNEYASF